VVLVSPCPGNAQTKKGTFETPTQFLVEISYEKRLFVILRSEDNIKRISERWIIKIFRYTGLNWRRIGLRSNGVLL
jgi:hypothetical protein